MARERMIPLQVLMRYFRVPTGDLPVDYPGRELLLGSRITNVSMHGVFVRTKKPLAQGAELVIRFRLPGSKDDIRARTVVRWSQRPEGRGKDGGMGLEFVDLERTEQKVIEKFVKGFIEKMRKNKG